MGNLANRTEPHLHHTWVLFCGPSLGRTNFTMCVSIMFITIRILGWDLGERFVYSFVLDLPIRNNQLNTKYSISGQYRQLWLWLQLGFHLFCLSLFILMKEKFWFKCCLSESNDKHNLHTCINLVFYKIKTVLTFWTSAMPQLAFDNYNTSECLSSCSSGGMRIGFTASVSSRTNCIGPFTRNSPIPYDVITLNHGHGYNPALGKCSQVVILTPYLSAVKPLFMCW